MRIVVLIVVIPSALAGPVEEWNSIFGGVSHDLGGSLRFTSDGGFLITDLTYSYGAGGDLSLSRPTPTASGSGTGPTEAKELKMPHRSRRLQMAVSS